MPNTITQAEADVLNNMSPAAQNILIGNKLKSALDGDVAAGSIVTSKLADNAVTTAKIGAGAVETTDLAADAVTTAKIATGAVEASDIAVGAVETAKIATNAVSLAKIALDLKVGIAVDDAKTTSREENIAGLSSALTLCNSLKTVNNAHAADAAEHTTAIDNINYPIATANATDLAELLALAGELLTAYEAHNADAVLAAAWVFHAAQQAGNTLVSAVTPTTLQEAVTRLNDLKAKYNTHESSAVSHGVGSTHTEATADAAYGAAILVVEADVASGDEVVWGILDSGTGTVVGVTAVAGAGVITFTFDADPQNDAVITYAVFRTAT